MNDISLYENIPELENSFSVKIRFSSSKNTSLFTHWHEHMELLYFTKGSCLMTCNGQTFPVEAGDLVVVNSNEIHSYASADNLEHFYVILYPHFFSDISFRNFRFQSLIKSDVFVKERIFDMYKEYANRRVGNDMMIKSYAYSLITYLMRQFSVIQISDKDYNSHILKLNRLDQVLKYISDHYNEKISIPKLAEQIFLTESHFCRFFKKSTGKTPVNYINELRVERAAVLLKNTDESITKIAAHVGFDDVNYFSRVFKKEKGISPGNFKSQNK